MTPPEAVQKQDNTSGFEKSACISIQRNQPKTLKGRHVGILIADATNGGELDELRQDIEKTGARVSTIAPHPAAITLSDGSLVAADAALISSPSQIFDAIALCLSTEAAADLCADSNAVEFILNAYVHLKAIGSTAGANLLLTKANVVADDGVTDLGARFIEAASQRFWDREAKIRKLC